MELTVDGVTFEVRHDESQPGAHHYTRLTAPAVGHGFTSRRSDHRRSSTEQHVEAVRAFLAQCDPVTGYIEDDDEDDG